MKLTTLKQIERAKYRLMRILDAAHKADPLDREVPAFREAATQDWLGWRHRLDRLEVQAAEKKDKGEVLFTIFYPDGDALRSITRTPRRLIHHYERQPWYASKPFPDRVDTRDQESWKWDLQYYLRIERERLERISTPKAA